jgi:4'-phosphopantetheinyl transferase
MTVELWYVDLDHLACHPDALEVVTASDRAEAGRLPSELLRRRLLARRAATRHVLACWLGLAPSQLSIVRRCPRCGEADHGRPAVSGASGDFSVSASGASAVIAIAEHRVGVDIETDTTGVSIRASLPTGVLAPAERALLDALSPDRRNRTFLRMWAVKEAVLKADGGGLSVDPSLVDTSTVVTRAVGRVTLAGQAWIVQAITPPLGLPAPVVLALAGTTEMSTSTRSLRW